MKARKLLLKLSTSCYKLPQKLFIQGVRHVTQHAVFAGGFGDVFRGVYEQQKVAVKRMRIFQRECDVPNQKFCKEALTWQGLSHPHIVPFLGIVEEEFPDVLCMVSPWMQHGTVLMYLNSYGRQNVNKFLHEIVQGLGYLHSRYIVHGDLRGANVLINDAGAACLSDFGLTVFNDTPATHSSRCEGAVRWMAPELYSPQQFGLERFLLTPESDIYAFACVCIELFTGNPPFIELRDPAVILRVMGGQRPARPMGSDPSMCDGLWSLVQACWAHDLALRPRVQEVAATIWALLNVVSFSLCFLPLHS
ncbi:kinase-like protein [Cylindrobasidium torrendii FP15055 ss-10]|uniref:Kinase-like protein n=1 Tax=Cylindrobasidium torrendii FP15055 ss-10 TaxID=1314674 RepID=A0A0D7AYT5_9AGAR|nr:kinase-like protein [Cylindrobasidium torrendii FP15055 ss-10]